jgi:general nucleoside transport system ATP-binding protein
MSENEQGPAADNGASVPSIRMTGISKSYEMTVANDAIDFDVVPAEIHVLLGENGAGKTTLMRTLFGMVIPDAGEIRLDGDAVQFESPHDALERGIGMVHQHFMLVQDFTVAENVVLGSVSPLELILRRGEIQRDVAQTAERFGMEVDATTKIRDLPIETQQRVEILKLLHRGAKVLILDEPTSSLGPAQIAALFRVLKDLRDNGRSIVMVTHKLSEVMEIADQVTVLKSGRKVMTVRKGDFDERTLARAMTGRELPELHVSKAGDFGGDPLLSVRDLIVHSGIRLRAVHGVSLDLHQGEILGIAGVEGNGQRELLESLAGIAEIDGGTVHVQGRNVTGASPKAMRQAGVSVIHEDRQGWGLVLDMTLAENLALADVPTKVASKHGFLTKRTIKHTAGRLLQEYDVRPADPEVLALSLSGGNQQKLVLARELAPEPNVLVAANPTTGLDIGAAEYVHRRLLDVRKRGGGILLISNDLDELLTLSDRLLVLYRGRVVYQAPVRDVSMDGIALAMAGTPPPGAAEDDASKVSTHTDETGDAE